MYLIYILFNALFILIKAKTILNLIEKNSKKYLEFSFNRNLTISSSMLPAELFKSLFYNQIYIKIKIGSEKIEIPFYLYLQQYSLIIQSSQVSEDQVKGLYDNTKSKTYSSESKEESFIVIDMYEGILSKDNFYLSNDNNEKYLFDFYLSKKNHDESHITEGGKIGFKFESECAQSKKAFFITNLKRELLISNLIFSLKYESGSSDKGKLYIGAYPHLINNNCYKEEYYLNDKASKIFSNVEWAFYINEIKSGINIIENNADAYLYFEIGYIIGTQKYFDFLFSLDSWKEYFSNKNNKCHEAVFKINDFEKNDIYQKLVDYYTIYYCDKDVDIKKINIGDLYFMEKMLNYSFHFASEDLWEEKNGFKYFKIIKQKYNNEYWYLGKPFFEKFQLIFDYDNKKIGLYSKIFSDNDVNDDKNSGQNIIIYILIILGLSIIIVGLIFLIIKIYKKFPKKKKANELIDDNYVYESTEIN